ncbi:LOW QUALITY PROTEIN: hypothetical protein AQUCO_00600405v1 [Aquilegia coerulea]|uniref:Uncharacterized protein n=1 Tax=Aquilegia coerulea TaxID=218851 RepID=A0A2G5EPJ1_AQUCA|nr:LOW QUALITY PROTEIN: hypothetical protein AQUCO_00600405v1 [Aquilegia coerulea]
MQEQFSKLRTEQGLNQASGERGFGSGRNCRCLHDCKGVAETIAKQGWAVAIGRGLRTVQGVCSLFLSYR